VAGSLQNSRKGNVRLIYEAAEAAELELTGREVRNVNYFPSIANIPTMLESRGLEVRQAWLFGPSHETGGWRKRTAELAHMFGEKTFGAMPDDIRSQWIECTQQKARASLFREGVGMLITAACAS